MPYSSEHKAQSRENILEAAAELFCRYGFDSVSLASVMKKASMTHGGFYAHFTSKTMLYAEAIRYAALSSPLCVANQNNNNLETMVTFIKSYLSLDHIQQNSFACPIAFLSTDVAHREPVVRESYEKTFRGMVSRVASMLEQSVDSGQAENYARHLVVNLVGTVAISRSLNSQEMQETLLTSTELRLLEWLASVTKKVK